LRVPIADLHEDISYHILEHGYRDFSSDIEGRHADIPKYRRGGVRLVFAAIFPAIATWDPRISEALSRGYGSQVLSKSYKFRAPLSLALEHFKVYYRLARAFSGDLFLVRTRGDLERLGRGEEIGLLISIEGAEVLEDPHDMELLFNLGARSLTITWNYDNRYAASCMSKRDYGLTGEGEELVSAANELGIVLDVSHASKKTAIDVTSASKRPVIASHSNYYGVHRHARNVDDEVIEAIKGTGGVVGFTLITSTIGEKANVKSLADHVYSVWERFGPDVIAIGTDFFGIEETPQGLEDASRLPTLLKELGERGIGDGDLRKIAWENVMRVLEAHASSWP